MFGDLKLLMDLQANRENPEILVKIYQNNRERLAALKEKYPQWKELLKPEVLQELKRQGVPVD